MKRLLRAGAKVYLAARNETQATEVIAQLKREDDLRGEVVYLKLDLSDPRLARKSAEEFKTKENRLDILGECCLDIPSEFSAYRYVQSTTLRCASFDIFALAMQ